MTDCGFSVIELEMATSRDVQSARVTTKDLKDVHCTDTTKRGQQDGFSDQARTPERRWSGVVTTSEGGESALPVSVQ